MKKYLILLLLAAVYGPLSAQHEVHDFYSLMTAVPVDEDSSVISLKNTDSMVVVKRYPLGNISEFYLKSLERIGPDIDNLGIIDYKSDTVFILNWWDTFSVFFILKTKTDSIAFNLDTNPVDFSKVEFPEYMDFGKFINDNHLIKKSFFEIFADWSEEKFIELAEKYRYGYILSSSADSDILMRFIIKDGLLIKKDIYYYDPIVLKPEDAFEYWQTHILPNKE